MPAPPNPNWRIIVLGTKVQLKFSHFFKSKNNMIEPTCELMHRWGQAGIVIKKLKNGQCRRKYSIGEEA